jgi:hypothetical protein
VKHPPNPWYVTGFIEGSGSFTYSRSGDSVVPYFALKVGAADRALLQEMQGFFGGAGRIYDLRDRTAAGSESLGGAAYFRITRVVDLLSVIAHFERYPLAGSKAAVYEVWCDLVAAKQRFRRPDKARIADIAARLSQVNRRGNRGKN